MNKVLGEADSGVYLSTVIDQFKSVKSNIRIARAVTKEQLVIRFIYYSSIITNKLKLMSLIIAPEHFLSKAKHQD